MPKYLLNASYSVEGLKGLHREGGTSRRDAVGKVIESLGGTLDAFYYAFGKSDVILIVDLPDNESVAAFNIVVNTSGAAIVSTTVLLTPEEIDHAVKKQMIYRPPGELPD